MLCYGDTANDLVLEGNKPVLRRHYGDVPSQRRGPRGMLATLDISLIKYEMLCGRFLAYFL